MTCISSGYRYTTTVFKKCTNKAKCQIQSISSRSTSFVYSLICLCAPFVTTYRTALSTGQMARLVLPGTGQGTWSRSYSSRSGLPQAYLLSELKSCSTEKSLLSPRNRRRLALSRSAVISMSQMVWRWL